MLLRVHPPSLSWLTPGPHGYPLGSSSSCALMLLLFLTLLPLTLLRVHRSSVSWSTSKTHGHLLDPLPLVPQYCCCLCCRCTSIHSGPLGWLLKFIAFFWLSLPLLSTRSFLCNLLLNIAVFFRAVPTLVPRPRRYCCRRNWTPTVTYYTQCV